MKKEAIKILLVEDNPDHALLTQAALEGNSMINNIFVAKDGQEALDIMYHRREYSDAPIPSLILLDINLPKVDGFGVLRQLKKNPAFKSIPVIMLTTSAEREDVSRGYAEGANSFVTKPAKFDECCFKINNILLYWLTTNTLPIR